MKPGWTHAGLLEWVFWRTKGRILQVWAKVLQVFRSGKGEEEECKNDEEEATKNWWRTRSWLCSIRSWIKNNAKRSSRRKAARESPKTLSSADTTAESFLPCSSRWLQSLEMVLTISGDMNNDWIEWSMEVLRATSLPSSMKHVRATREIDAHASEQRGSTIYIFADRDIQPGEEFLMEYNFIDRDHRGPPPPLP